MICLSLNRRSMLIVARDACGRRDGQKNGNKNFDRSPFWWSRDGINMPKKSVAAITAAA